MSKPKMKINIWGVCGGIPTPLPVRFLDAALELAVSSGKPPEQPIYYGGNTLCVSVEAGGQLFIFDMGTGARLLGQSLHRLIPREARWSARVLVSHLHNDHIVGFPYFGPIYRPNVDLAFCGPNALENALDNVLQNQHKDPGLSTLAALGMNGTNITFSEAVANSIAHLPGPGDDPAVVHCEELNHPGMTLGYRLEAAGQTFVYTVDFEGESPPSRKHIRLVTDADVWVTDCQFTKRQYDGDPASGLRSRKDEGHANPEHVIAIANEARPKRIVTIHHDPDSGPEAIRGIAAEIQEATGIPTRPAREGDVIEL